MVMHRTGRCRTAFSFLLALVLALALMVSACAAPQTPASPLPPEPNPVPPAASGGADQPPPPAGELPAQPPGGAAEESLIPAEGVAEPSEVEPVPAEDPAAQPEEGEMGVADAVPFEPVGEATLSPALRQWVDQVGRGRGVFHRHDEGYTYIVVGAGEKPTGGYSVRVTAVLQQEAGLQVQVEESGPAPGDMVIQALTYPRAVVRIPRQETTLDVLFVAK